MAMEEKDVLMPQIYRAVDVHLPQMAFSGLSETWLMKELGDLHWSLLASATQVPSDEVLDRYGRRLLTSFVRVRYESTVPLQAYGENQHLTFHASMNRFGRTMLFSDVFMSGESGELRASLMSMFSARVAGKRNVLANSQPKGALLDVIPALKTMPPLAADYQRLGNASQGQEEGLPLLLGEEAFEATSDVIFSTEYEIKPHDDLNGLNLVYFAAYPKIHDSCELTFFREIQRHFGLEEDWFSVTSVMARDVFYFGNCDVDDVIIFTLSQCQFIEGRRIQLQSRFTRKSDGKDIALIQTVKQLGEAGEGYGRLWEEGLPTVQGQEQQPAPLMAKAGSDWAADLEAMLVSELAQVLKQDASRIARDASFKTLGINSMAVAEFAGRFEAVAGLPIEPGWLYSDLSIRTLATQLATDHAAEAPAAPMLAVAKPAAASSQFQRSVPETDNQDIAVIGLSLRLPGADDPEEFWRNLADGRDLVGAPPQDRKDLWGNEQNAARFEGGFLDGIQYFDPLFFRISPREAERMDPQQRILLEEAWKAVENAGYRASSLRGSDTGVFVGISNGDYDELLLRHGAASEFQGVAGSAFSIAANRISYLMDFRGPSLAIDTACSSSLVAVHQAVRALRSGECGLALAGGVNINCTSRRFQAFAGAGMLSPDWRCKTFDKRANGYVRGEGGAFVLLKPLAKALADGDHVHGIILGSAINHGGTVNTLTTPNPDAQARLIDAAWPKDRVDPDSIGYFEAHGTGTPLGDPIEITGIKTAFEGFYRHWAKKPAPEPHCGVGSVKSNIGHLESAAGIAGLIKVLLSFQHRTIPSTVHFHDLNPHIHLKGSPLYLVAQKRAWEEQTSSTGERLPLRAGVSSFGSGGVNAHVALQAAIPPRLPVTEPQPAIMTLSAASTSQLKRYAQRLVRYLDLIQAPSQNGPRSPNDLPEKITRIIAEITCNDTATLNSACPIADLGLSALEHSHLPSLIAGELGVDARVIEIAENMSILTLAEHLAKHVPDRAMPVETDRPPRLEDLAYTLQTGREAMQYRLAFVADTVMSVRTTLQSYAEGRPVAALYQGEASQSPTDDGALKAALAKRDLSVVARLWAEGQDVDWTALHQGPRLRVPLPTYPFAREFCWIAPPAEAAPIVQSDSVASHQTMGAPPLGHDRRALMADLRMVFEEELGLKPGQMQDDQPFERYGVDSLLLSVITGRLEAVLGTKLDPTIFLENPTLSALASHMLARLPLPAATQVDMICEPATRSKGRGDIAVVGMACRFPGASNIAEFWDNLARGVSSIREVPANRWDSQALYAPTPVPGKTNSKWGGFLDGVEDFDPAYFGIHERDAAEVDPLIRLALEVGVEAVCDAGYRRDELDGRRVGVFMGARVLNYADRIETPSKSSIVNILQNFIAANLAQFYNLRGPNMVVDTACSSSLTSIHLACKSLLHGDADMALAGGVDYLLDEFLYVMLSEARALSPDGACHTFDEKANGFVPGEGCGIVVLKRLEDAVADGDRVLAVIEGSAINNDGRTMGITTPNPAAQKDVVREALAAAGADPGSLSYIEAHGTGTMIGDPIEIRALSAAMGDTSGETGFCAVGSVKSNIGHALSAAGVAGVIKVVLALQNRQIPPTVYCEHPNPRIGFDQSPFYPNRRLQEWQPRQGVRRAGISSFGFGGSNAHVVLRGAEQIGTRQPLDAPQYARKRHWLMPRSRSAPMPKQNPMAAILPLTIDAQSSNTLWVARTQLTFDCPLIANHLVHDVRVLPGVALIELVHRSLKLWGVDPSRTILSHILFEEPVAVAPGRSRDIEISIDPTSQPFKVSVRNRDAADGPWRHNFGCTLNLNEPLLAQNLDLESLRAKALRVVDLDTAYAATRSVSIRHTGFMKSAGRIFELADGALAELELDVSAQAHIADFDAHPAHLDTSTVVPFFRQSGLTDGQSGQMRPFIPIYVDRFRLSAPLPKQVYVRVISGAGRNQESDVLHSSIQICDAEGRVLCEMTGLALKRIRAADDIGRLVAAPAAKPAVIAPTLVADPPRSSAAQTTDLRHAVEQDLRHMFAPLIEQPPEAIAADQGFYELGLDSVALLTIARQLEERLGERIYPTLLFEYSTLTSLSAHLSTHFAGKWHTATEQVPEVPSIDGSHDLIMARCGWREAQAEFLAPAEQDGLTLVITDDPALFERVHRLALRNHSRLVQIEPATGFVEKNSHAFSVHPHNADDFRKVFARLRNQGGRVARILYLASRREQPDSPTTHRLHAMTTLVQAMMHERWPYSVRVVYGYHQDESPASLLDAAMEGLLKTLHLETDRIDLRLVASAAGDTATPHQPVWVEQVWRELFVQGTVPVVHYANGQRFERAFFLTDHGKDALPANPGVDKTWLITGGLGGLGLIFAEHLATIPGARLVLTGRRQPTVQDKARLKSLEERGARVLWVTADVSRLEDTRHLIAEACRTFGTIHGIIHAAGVLRDGLILHKTAEDMAAVLAPKITGTLNLDACTAHLPLEHLILFSSSAAVLGNLGQSDYAYGNAFLDAFAVQRDVARQKHQRHGATISINWPLWDKGGMRGDAAAVAKLTSETGLVPLSTSHGVRALLIAMSAGEARPLVLEGNAENLIRAFDLVASSKPIAPVATPAIIHVSSEGQAKTAEPINTDEPLAIVGVSGRYPKADTLDEFWRNLRDGRDCIDEAPVGRFDLRDYFNANGPQPGKTYSKWGGFLDQVDGFDPLMFNISPAEAEMMDPQERLFLEACWEVLEDAGYGLESMRREKTGVFVGSMWSHYSWLGIEEGMKGNPVYPWGLSSSIANRASYFFDFHGPSFALDTMCSSSLTAIHLACESIRRGECNQAIAGGVNLMLHPAKYVILSQMRMMSTDGRCRAFGEGGDGYVPGEGVGAILIKPLSRALEQGDHIHALIRASAINHGGRASGFTVPNVEAQSEVIRTALARAGVEPASISYIEAHGTGTSLGDPIEIVGLTQSYGVKDGRRIAIGSVKSNVGHLEAAAGIAAVTKVVLQMKHRQLVPSLHADHLNPNIDFARSPIKVQRSLETWAGEAQTSEAAPLRAGVSSFGAGGANAHIILESFTPAALSEGPERSELIVLSARTPEALRASAERLADALAFPIQMEAVSSSGIKEKLKSLICALTGLSEMEEDEPLGDYGIGIIGWSQLADDIAAAFNLNLPASTLAAAATVNAIAAMIASESAEGAKTSSSLPLGAVAYTLQVGRTALADRLAFVARNVPEAVAKLRAFAGGENPADLLTGRVQTGALPSSSPTSLGDNHPDWQAIATSWIAGAPIDWAPLHGPNSRRRVPLPTYPFQRKRYWLPSAAPRAQQPLAKAALDPSIGFFAPVWKPAPLPVAAPGVPNAPQIVLVLCRDVAALRGFIQSLSLRERNAIIIGVTSGRAAEKRGERLYAARWSEGEDWSQIFAWLSQDHGLPNAVFILRTPQAQDTSLPLDEAVQQDAQFCFAFERELMLATLGRTLEGYYLCPAQGNDIEPRDLAVLAALKSIGWESPDHRSRLIALKTTDFDAGIWANCAVNEWRVGEGGPDEVLYQNGQRLARGLERDQSASHSTVSFRRGGAYLITGGMGEIGQRLAEKLVKEFSASVYLTGRTPMDAGRAAKLKAMTDGAAGRVSYHAVDICDEPALRALVQQIAAKTGGLNGVLHLARAVEDGLVLQKKPESVEKVLAAKVRGSLVLDRATADQPLDLFVMFSSMAGMFGLRGSADYAFACGFQNGFAASRSADVAAGRRSGISRALCWSQWEYDPYSNAGRDAQFEAVGFRLIDMAAGFEALQTSLAVPHAALAVVRGDPAQLDSLAGGDALRRLFAPPSTGVPKPKDVAVDAPLLKKSAGALASRIASLSDADLLALLNQLGISTPTLVDRVAAPTLAHGLRDLAPQPVAKPVAKRESVEATLRRIMTEVLKLDDTAIDLNRPLQDYGVDSVTAVQMAVKLEKALKTDVPAKLLAAHATAEDAVREIEKQSSLVDMVS
ncbi:putative biosynthetic protein (TIGR04098 family) [Agrobacterium vitis]|nr:putative biosynthetic protein (TIGR04098 family) [Agrobacterium vitis]MBE1436374.1 putative biosynthetic protein (TIGR04098 family) [Agrobacterium vitis]